MARDALFAFASTLSFEEDEALEKLTYWGEGGDGRSTSAASRAEAYASIEAVFGKYLPQQYKTWDDLDTDAGIAELCIVGVGSWYLKASRSAAAAGHDVPPESAFECNIEYMSRYDVRSTWCRYGASAYLGTVPADGSLPPLLGVWSCSHSKLFTPSDALWGHAKALFKATLGASLTLRDHLLHTHWILSNGLDRAARTTLSPTHPLRRLLKPHYYGAAKINSASMDLLMPVGGFAHRTFALTAESWTSYFADMAREWTYVPFPEPN